MELDITEFFNNAEPRQYSASQAELGEDAGRLTWENAKDAVDDWPILKTDAERCAFRAHVREFGAWSDDEIAAWSNGELNALAIQMISGDIREFAELDGKRGQAWNWAEYEALAMTGTIGGRMFQGDAGRIYYYAGA